MVSLVERQAIQLEDVNDDNSDLETALYICRAVARWKRSSKDVSAFSLERTKPQKGRQARVDLAFQHLSLAERFLLLEAREKASEHIHAFAFELKLVVHGFDQDISSHQLVELSEAIKTLADVLEIQLMLSGMARSEQIPTKITFLLGMHRSGTSALAGALCQNGFSAPNDLMPANHGNIMGYFESQGLVSINDNFLSLMGREWNSIQPLPSGWQYSKEARLWKEKVITHISKVFQPTDHALIKDPRLSILIPGLCDWLECLEFDVSVILQIRHPFESANSIKAIQNVPIQDGIRLWSYYNITAERSTRFTRRLVATYDELLEDSTELVGRICERFKSSQV